MKTAAILLLLGAQGWAPEVRPAADHGLVTARGYAYHMTEWLAYVAAGKGEDPPEARIGPCEDPQGYSSDMDVDRWTAEREAREWREARPDSLLFPGYERTP